MVLSIYFLTWIYDFKISIWKSLYSTLGNASLKQFQVQVLRAFLMYMPDFCHAFPGLLPQVPAQAARQTQKSHSNHFCAVHLGTGLYCLQPLWCGRCFECVWHKHPYWVILKWKWTKILGVCWLGLGLSFCCCCSSYCLFICWYFRLQNPLILKETEAINKKGTLWIEKGLADLAKRCIRVFMLFRINNDTTEVVGAFCFFTVQLDEGQ